MRALARSLRETGPSIPVPYPSLAKWIRPRPGHLLVVLAAPGVGKSTFALDWALKAEIPVLAVSLDTSLQDQALRVAAHISGQSMNLILEEVEAELASGSTIQWADYLEAQQTLVRFTDVIRSVDELDELISAEIEYWGEAPLVILDDARSVMPGEDSASGYKALFKGLHQLAQDHNCVIFTLHHITRGEASDGDVAPTMSSGLYASEHDVQISLGLWRPNPAQIAVSVLKQRMGPANSKGTVAMVLNTDLEHARLTEPINLGWGTAAPAYAGGAV